MKVHVFITAEPLEGHPDLVSAPPHGCGAFSEFRGVVRPMENGLPIQALEYEAYQPMAEQQIERILRELSVECPCEEIRVGHRIGIIAAGSAAVVVQAASFHRQEAFAMITRFMDRLKQDVPIWKVRAIS